MAASLDAAAPGGRIAVCGATTGPNPPAALHRIWWKQLSILGSTMGTSEDFAGAYELVASGRARARRRRGLPARGDPRRARAARGRRAARQDRAPHPGLSRDASAEAEDELRVFGHPLRGPRRVEGELDLDVLDTGHLAPTRVMSSWIIGPAGQPIDVSVWMTLTFGPPPRRRRAARAPRCPSRARGPRPARSASTTSSWVGMRRV